ncbi:MAG: TRAP transporter small permease subunit [Gammaproteobacteria bacterium]
MHLAEPHWITGFRHALLRIDMFMAGSSLMILLGLVFGQVIARNFFHSSIPHADIVSRYMVLYVTFFGAGLAIEYHKHIRIDVCTAWMRPEKLLKLRPLLYLISAAICSVLTWAAGRFWYDDWQYVADYERWASILALITPFGFFLLALHFLISGLFTPPADENIP